MWKRNKRKEEKPREKIEIKLEGYPYIKDIVHFNTQYCSISPYGDKTLLKTPDSVIKSTLFSRNNRFLSEEFLLNHRSDNGNLGFRTGLSSFFQPSAIMTESNRELGERLDDVVYLSQPEKLKAAIGMTMILRRSVRYFEKIKFPLKDISSIMYYAQGISAMAEIEGVIDGPNKIAFRTAPSGGGLYPIKIYCVLKDVEEINDGLYQYLPYAHGIRLVREISDEECFQLAEFSNINIENVNVALIYEYNLYENGRKYGDNGCSYAFIEAGEIAQNVQLSATALGYGSCDIGGYEKHFAEEMIYSDHITSHVIHMQIIGKEGEKCE